MSRVRMRWQKSRRLHQLLEVHPGLLIPYQRGRASKSALQISRKLEFSSAKYFMRRRGSVSKADGTKYSMLCTTENCFDKIAMDRQDIHS